MKSRCSGGINQSFTIPTVVKGFYFYVDFNVSLYIKMFFWKHTFFEALSPFCCAVLSSLRTVEKIGKEKAPSHSTIRARNVSGGWVYPSWCMRTIWMSPPHVALSRLEASLGWEMTAAHWTVGAGPPPSWVCLQQILIIPFYIWIVGVFNQYSWWNRLNTTDTDHTTKSGILLSGIEDGCSNEMMIHLNAFDNTSKTTYSMSAWYK